MAGRVSTGESVSAAEHVAAVQHRVLGVLVVAQLLGGAGLAAGLTVGALLAEDVLGSTVWAGVPVALFTGGSALAAVLVGRLSQAYGRRIGLTVGYAAGAAGAVGIVVGAAADQPVLLLGAMGVYGSGMTANLQARYAGADLAPPQRRARAVSTVLVASTAGAVAGPNLASWTDRVGTGAGLPELTGPFVMAAVAYTAAALVLGLLLRPDPLLLAREYAAELAEQAPTRTGPIGNRSAPGSARGADQAGLAAGAMVLTMLVMVAVMTMTPVHLRDHGHGLDEVGVVIGLHVAFMYLPSPLTGWLADRYGRRPVLAAAGLTLLAAGVLAALAPEDSVLVLAVALALLGLGWNGGLVAGTAMLTDATPVADRARRQGNVDLAVALAGAAGGVTSGAVVAFGDYGLLGWSAAVLSLLLLPAVTRRDRR